MKIGQFIEKNQTTRDTLRYYIEEGLLNPEKRAGHYWFTEKEQGDFEAIREFRELGFSIKGIQTIQANRVNHGCGSLEQWASNREIILSELADIASELGVLESRQARLEEVLVLLDEKLPKK